jgi:hypothetical protein
MSKIVRLRDFFYIILFYNGTTIIRQDSAFQPYWSRFGHFRPSQIASEGKETKVFLKKKFSGVAIVFFANITLSSPTSKRFMRQRKSPRISRHGVYVYAATFTGETVLQIFKVFVSLSKLERIRIYNDDSKKTPRAIRLIFFRNFKNCTLFRTRY